MAKRIFHYQREWQLQATPDALWPFVANTHLTNYHSGNPALHSILPAGVRLPNGYHLLRALITEFEEEPFEWIRPFRYASIRRFRRVKVFDKLGSSAELIPHSQGGTRLIYTMWASAGHWYTIPLVPLILRQVVNAFNKPFHAFDDIAKTPSGTTLAVPAKRVRLAAGGQAKLQQLLTDLTQQPINTELVGRLGDIIYYANDLDLATMRPYAIADYWQASRRETVDLFLWATRLGLLDMRWEILCPLCRGDKGVTDSLATLDPNVHCASCNIDFTANFARSVELVFSPTPTVRRVRDDDFCVGGPHLTPHIMVQQLLAPAETRDLTLPLENGRYRLRTLELRGSQALVVTPDGRNEYPLTITADGWSNDEVVLAPATSLHVSNQTETEQLFVIERTAWSDQALTGAEVIAQQTFRDLFADEALRPGEQIAVGSMAILFTDLRDSTRMYRQMGDAVAFGRVLNHFDILKEIIHEADGAIVKTIGDAIMGAFVQPVAALRAVLQAQRALLEAEIPLYLKAGLHFGPCIAVTLNGRLDYFGSTVNLAARLEKLAGQQGVVISHNVYSDPHVTQFLTDPANALTLTPIQAEVKGFEGENFTFWRLTY